MPKLTIATFDIRSSPRDLRTWKVQKRSSFTLNIQEVKRTIIPRKTMLMWSYWKRKICSLNTWGNQRSSRTSRTWITKAWSTWGISLRLREFWRLYMLVWAQGKCNICRGSKFIHLVIIEEDRCKNLKQFCSGRVSCFFLFFLHPSLCKVLKLTFARDIRRLPQDDFIKSEMSYGSMRQVISVLTPWHIHLSCTTLVSFWHGSLVSTFKWPRVEVSEKNLDSLSRLKCHAAYMLHSDQHITSHCRMGEPWQGICREFGDYFRKLFTREPSLSST